MGEKDQLNKIVKLLCLYCQGGTIDAHKTRDYTTDEGREDHVTMSKNNYGGTLSSEVWGYE